MAEESFRARRSTLAARVAVLALFVLSLYLLFQVFQPFLPGIAWAVFLVTAFYPMHQRLSGLLKGREWTAAIISTLIVTMLIVLPVGYLVAKVATSVRGLGLYLHTHVDEWNSKLQEQQGIVLQLEILKEKIQPFVDLSSLDFKGMIIDSLQNAANFVAKGTAPLIQNIFKTLISLIVMIATMGVLFREGQKVLVASLRALPLQESDKEAVVKRLLEVSRAVFYGIMMTAAVQALLGTLSWIIVGLPQALTFGLMMFFAAFIPFGGTALVWGPGAVYLFVKGYMFKGFLLVALGVGVVSMVDNFLKPIFISGRSRLHILLVFFGVFGGISAFGLPGFFLGPLVITFFLVLVEIVRRDLFQAHEYREVK